MSPFALLMLVGSAAAEPTYTWLGTTGMVIRDGSTTILVDPVVSRPGLAQVMLHRPVRSDLDAIDAVIRSLGLSEALAVLVTHSHFDHAMDAPFFAQRLGATLMGTASTLNIGRGAGMAEDRLRELSPGETLTLGSLIVQALEAVHSPVFGEIPYEGFIEAPLVQPAPVDAYKMGGSLNYAFQSAEGNFLFHPAARTAAPLEGLQATVVFQGLATRVSDEDVWTGVLDPVGARKVIPVHFDNFFAEIRREPRSLFTVHTRRFIRFAEAMGLDVELPKYLRQTPIFD